MFNYENNEVTSMLAVGTLVVVSVVGIIVNAFLLCVLRQLPERSTSFTLIWTVGGADLLLCGFTLAMCIARPILQYPGAYHSWYYCSILGSATFFFSSMSGILMGFLAMERYSVICHQKGLRHGFIWFSFFFIAAVFGVLLTENALEGGFAPEPSFIFCMAKGSEWSLYTNYVFYVLLNTPIAIFSFCYIAIFIKCYTANVPSDAEVITKRVAIRSLLFLAIYLLCYIPKLSTTIIGIYFGLNALPKALYMIIPIGMTMLAVVNPILVLLLHRHIKARVRSLLLHKKPEAIRLD
ncbi:hypothetical protein DSO57_1039499 [Entomophthora muscae]|uniref:Uncharacterized protein n=2 Tax=Entomophthora muscae TaxID=34485 RepID=A0ACC2RTN4_9FUNG|nr:hypothetical protein DSO57_1024576 [Entomophthora muscae]KAJ9071189.1 hypothetical protein DSO57_1039499 [Entomophthora muscae]